MNFSEALEVLRQGGKVRRRAWRQLGSVRGASVEIIQPVTLPDGRVTTEMLMVSYPDNNLLRPFSGANWDILEDDWEIIE
jgi:hypothetical protein